MSVNENDFDHEEDDLEYDDAPEVRRNLEPDIVGYLQTTAIATLIIGALAAFLIGEDNFGLAAGLFIGSIVSCVAWFGFAQLVRDVNAIRRTLVKEDEEVEDEPLEHSPGVLGLD